jgi:hypothetical protein
MGMTCWSAPSLKARPAHVGEERGWPSSKHRRLADKTFLKHPDCSLLHTKTLLCACPSRSPAYDALCF